MRKTWKYLLMAAVVLGLSFTVTSCKDDDDDKKSEEKKTQEEQAAQQKADIFWAVMSQLAGTDAYTADYEGKTFEPVIGEADATNPMVRIVSTNDMASAAKRFADLVDASIDASTPSFTWTNDAVGTLTYTKTNNGQSWATVDVSIKTMPRLQQIIYRSPEQAGTNASKKGTCYYRFGDVVRKVFKDKDDNNKERVEFWVCVRPAFNPEGKGDSHWITLSLPPKKYIWTYTTKTGVRYDLPTGIGTNKEHMQNLAEMIYAILHPYKWQQNVMANPAPGVFSSGLRMFHDFSHEEDMVKYHSPWFWKRVAKAWQDHDIEELDGDNILAAVFGYQFREMKAFKDEFENNGLYLLAKGYSWWTSSSNNLSLFQYHYQNGQQYESNMHKETYTEVKKAYTELKSPINIYDETGGVDENYTPVIMNPDFFGDAHPRFVIRHATGKELAGFKVGAYETMCTQGNGLTDVYTYNKYYHNNVNSNEGPEAIQPKVGDVICKDGLFYTNPSLYNAADTKPVAIVTYVGEGADASGEYGGLAMSMELANDNKATWCDVHDYLCIEDTKDNEKEWVNQLNGYERTKKLARDGHNHQAASLAYEYQMEGFNPQGWGFTGWFLPTAGQIAKCVQGMGATAVLKKEDGIVYSIEDPVGLYSRHLQRFQEIQKINDLNATFWTSTEHTKENAAIVNMSPNAQDDDEANYINAQSKTARQYVRPFFAF